MKQDETSRVLLSLMHSFFCKADHKNVCEFYEEIELADCWDLPSVNTWVTITKIVMGALNLNEQSLLSALQKVSRQLSSLRALTESERLLFDATYRESDLSILIPEESHVSEVLPLKEIVEGSCLLSQEYLRLLDLDGLSHK